MEMITSKNRLSWNWKTRILMSLSNISFSICVSILYTFWLISYISRFIVIMYICIIRLCVSQREEDKVRDNGHLVHGTFFSIATPPNSNFPARLTIFDLSYYTLLKTNDRRTFVKISTLQNLSLIESEYEAQTGYCSTLALRVMQQKANQFVLFRRHVCKMRYHDERINRK